MGDDIGIDELLGMTSLEREAQGESGGKRPVQPTTGAVGRDAVPPSSELSDASDGDSVAARRGGDVPAEAGKYSSSYSPTEEA